MMRPAHVASSSLPTCLSALDYRHPPYTFGVSRHFYGPMVFNGLFVLCSCCWLDIMPEAMNYEAMREDVRGERLQ